MNLARCWLISFNLDSSCGRGNWVTALTTSIICSQPGHTELSSALPISCPDSGFAVDYLHALARPVVMLFHRLQQVINDAYNTAQTCDNLSVRPSERDETVNGKKTKISIFLYCRDVTGTWFYQTVALPASPVALIRERLCIWAYR